MTADRLRLRIDDSCRIAACFQRLVASEGLLAIPFCTVHARPVTRLGQAGRSVPADAGMNRC